MAYAKQLILISPAHHRHGPYASAGDFQLLALFIDARTTGFVPGARAGSFARIECARAETLGFCGRAWPQPYDEGRSFIIELKLDRELYRG